MKIAVIGIGCRYPGAHSAREFFENIMAGRRAFRQMPKQRWPLDGYYHPDKNHPDTTYCKKAALVENFAFEPANFRIPRNTFLATDTAQWMALTVAQEALRDADIDPAQNSRTGVIIGNTLTGEVSRATLMRYRWPYVKKVFSELLDNFYIEGQEKNVLLKKIERRYKAPFAPVNEDNLAGGLSNTIAGRICNFFDFKGGGFSTDGACSSSLLAINQACIGLVHDNCDIALAGGVDISLDPFEVVGFAKVGALSDSDIRVYDNHSDGFLPGEGCGIVVLQRYEDALSQGKSIYAVINGIGISSDGKGGITAPSVSGQRLAVSQAYSMAEYNFDQVELIEGHGTGTPTGDKVELTTFVGSKKDSEPEVGHHCGLGSIKSNIGHTKAAAGVAGFIKAVMSVRYGIMPATQGIRTPNELFDQSPHLYPVLKSKAWLTEGSTRKAAVSSAGFGGINTHITLSANDSDEPGLQKDLDYYMSLASTSQSSEVFIIAGDTLDDFRKTLVVVRDAAEKISEAEMIDLAVYCAKKYAAGQLRLALVAEKPEQLAEHLALVSDYVETVDTVQSADFIDKKRNIFLKGDVHYPRVAFLFPGQSSQYLNMGQRLLERNTSMQSVWQMADKVLSNELPESLSHYVFRDLTLAGGEERQQYLAHINDTSVTQPAVAAASLAMLNFVKGLGIRPDIAIGHSLGEYAALCSAGILTQEEVMRLVARRGKAMANSSGCAGTMLSVNADEDNAQSIVDQVMCSNSGELVVANINAPQQTIISGDAELVELARQVATTKEFQAVLLPVSSAFHSSLMKNAAEEMRAVLGNVTFQRPRHLLISPSTGEFISDRCDFSELLTEQILRPVNYVKSLHVALEEDCEVFIEVGPGATLTSLTEQTLADKDVLVCATDIGDRGQHSQGLNRLVAYLFACGVPLNIQKLYDGRFTRAFALPYDVSFIASPCENPVDPLDLGIDRDVAGGFSINIGEQGSEESEEEEQAELTNDLNSANGLVAFITQKIVNDFGYSYDMLNEKSRLRDDLGLDSLKSAELAHEVLGTLGIRGDVAQMQNASLQELAEFVLNIKAGTGDEESYNQNSASNVDFIFPDWVQPFATRALPEALSVSEAALPSGQNCLVVYEQCTPLIDSLMHALEAQEHTVVTMDAMDCESIVDDFSTCLYVVNQPTDYAQWSNSDEASVLRHFARAKIFLALSKRLISLQTSTEKRFMLVGDAGCSLWYGETLLSPDHYEVGAGFIKTLHLEHPEISTRCINLIDIQDAEIAATRVVSELAHSGDGHADVAYTDGDQRYVAYLDHVDIDEFNTASKPIKKGDVILITGGAKGITAECALALATSVGAKLALVGSTTIPEQPDLSNEASLNVDRFQRAGLECQYYACNVLDKNNVNAMVAEVERDLGPIKAIIHAAGVNALQKIASADWDVFERVLRPKMQGLINLVGAVDLSTLHSLNIFSSVIATSGMAGNAEYAYANEWMNQFLKRVRGQYPTLECRAFGFSVWADVGMGVRLNSVDLLKNMGIGAIPVSQGADTFKHLMTKSWPDSTLVISSRMGSLDTLKFYAQDYPRKRFVENVLYLQPGIEVITEVMLTPEVDVFLGDHNYENSLLFPAVMGIEAMVENACACLEAAGKSKMSTPVLENLHFSRAIIVPDEGRAIRIYVQRVDSETVGETRVNVAIRSSITHYAQDYFSAQCVWRDDTKTPPEMPATNNAYLPLRPNEDLYGKILFQGPMFHNIIGYRELSPTHCVVDINIPPEIDLFNGDTEEFQPLYGSGQVRDTFLHAVQLCVPQYKILPVSMEQVSYHGYSVDDSNTRTLTLVASERERTKSEFLYDLAIFEASGRCVETISGFRCRIMGNYLDSDNLEKIYAAQRESENKFALLQPA